jgi:hypothetical protein
MISKRFLQLVHVLVHPFKATQGGSRRYKTVDLIASRRQD